MRTLEIILMMLLAVPIGATGVHLAEAALHRRWQVPVCAFCGQPLSRRQWSALLALVLAPRCRTCGKAIRWQRLYGELLLVGFWGLIVARYGLTWRVAYTLAASFPLMMVTVTDLEARLIPNSISLPAIGIALLTGLALGPALPYGEAWRAWHAPLGGLLFGGLFFLLFKLGTALLGDGALGEGDITLATLAGLLVGPFYVLLNFVLTVVLGGVIVTVGLLSRRLRLNSAVPYGPFITGATLLVMALGPDILAWWFR